MKTTKKNKLQVYFYGAVKQQLDCRQIEIEISPELDVQGVREELKDILSRLAPNCSKDLIDDSAVSTDERILSNNESLANIKAISILPPVCGG